jgi:SPP1 family predicted phage head-tail adaptor
VKGRLDKKILFQKLNKEEEWEDYFSCFASANIASGKEYVNSGAEQSVNSVVFETRYVSRLQEIYLDTQSYRIVFKGKLYDISNVDNYKFKNESLKFITSGGRNY